MPTAETDTTNQLITIEENREYVRLADGRRLRIAAWGKNAPPMICDPLGKINKGRPTSVYDLMYTQRLAGRDSIAKLTPALHAVPLKDAATCAVADYDTLDPHTYTVLSRRELHAAETTRPGPKNDVTLDSVRDMRALYWDGDETLASIAKKYDMSVPTARKYVYGALMWYA